MAQKTVEVEGLGRLVIARRRGTRNMRLSIRPDGSVRVGLPAWAPYAAGVDFALSRRDWILKHQPMSRQPLVHGQRIGKSYRLEFTSKPSAQPRTRVAANIISVASSADWSSQAVQTAAQKACERALKLEAEKLLVQRVSQIASRHGFSYQDIRLKRLRSRWGSCSENGRITLNYYLVQLPWPLIDYVITHELVHTRHLNHSREFWQAVEAIIPGAKQLKREMKTYRPVLIPAK